MPNHRWQIPDADWQALQSSVGASLAASARAIELKIAPFQTSALTALGQSLAGWALPYASFQPLVSRWLESWKAAFAGNWSDLDADEVMRIVEWMGRYPICLVWVPRAEIVSEVIRTRRVHTAHAALVRNRPAIIDDVRVALAEADDASVAQERVALLEALDALESGYTQAAQSLTATAFTSLLHGQLGEKRFKGIRRRATRTEDPEDVVMGNLRLYAILGASVEALRNFGPGEIPEEPPGFNRNSTVHTVAPEQFTEGKALSGLLLAVAFLREAHARRGGVSIADATLN